MKESSFNLCKFGMLSINMNQNIGFFPEKKTYVMIHVIKHDMDPNSNINYSRKIGPVVELPDSSQCLATVFKYKDGIQN